MKILIKSVNDFDNNFFQDIFQNLSFEKKNKLAKINSISEKKNYLLSLYLLNKLVEFNVYKTKFKYSNNGKPYFVNSNIHFNISHSNDMCAVVINENEIGLDIQKTKQKF